MADLRARIILDIGQAVQAVERLKGAIKGIVSSKSSVQLDTEKSVAQAREAGAKAGSSFVSGFQGVGIVALGSVIGNLIQRATSEVISFGKSIIEASAALEQMKTSFEVLVGDAKKSNELLAGIKEFAAKTPYETEDLAKAAQTMLGFGIAVEEVMPNLQAIGDIAMGNKEKLGALSLAFSQVSASGRLTGQDLLQMINAGFNPLRIISEKTGLSIGELKKRMEQGAISADMVREAFLTATRQGGQFYQMSAKQSQTFAGLMSTLKDNVKSFGVAIMKDVFEKLKTVLAGVVNYLGVLRDAMQKGGLKGLFETILPPAVGTAVFVALKGIVASVQTLFDIIWKLRGVIAPVLAFAGAWIGISKGIQLATMAITAFRTIWLGLSATITANPVGAILTGISVAATLIISNWDAVKKYFEGFLSWLTDGIGSIIKAVQNAWSWFKRLIGLEAEGRALSQQEAQEKILKGEIKLTQEQVRQLQSRKEAQKSYLEETNKGIIEKSLRAQQINLKENAEIRKAIDERIKLAKQKAEQEKKVEQEAFDWKKALGSSEVKEKKKEIEQKKKVVSEYLDWQKEQEERIARERSKTEIQAQIEELDYQKAILEERLNEFDTTAKTAKTIEEQKSILSEILALEIQRAQLRSEEAKRRVEEEYTAKLKEEQSKFQQAIEAAKGNKKQVEDIEKQHNDYLLLLTKQRDEAIEKVEKHLALEQERLKRETTRRMAELDKQLAESQQRTASEMEQTIVKMVEDTQRAVEGAIAGIIRREVDTSEVDKAMEDIEGAFLRAEITEAEYTKRRKELVERRKQLLQEESSYFGEAFAKSLEIVTQKLQETDPAFRQLQEQLNELVENIGKMAIEFREGKVSSMGAYFAKVTGEMAERYEVFVSAISVQTGLLAGALISKGIPALEAFKQAFLLSLLDMVEKTVIAQTPAISAIISGTIPFPANLPVIAAVMASIAALLEVAKARIRGAEHGYLAGFREGKPGRGDTMLIYVNPREAILPEWVVERNRETIKQMLQGISFDRAIQRGRQGVSFDLPVPRNVSIQVNANVGFKPIKFRGQDIILQAERYRTRIERLKQ